MKTFDETTAPGVLLQWGMKTISMGLGSPMLRPHVLAFKPLQDDLMSKRDAQVATGNVRLMAEGEAMLPAALCYEDVDDMQIDLAKFVGKDYTGPVYKSFFPKGLTAFKEQSPEELDKALPHFIQKLKDSGDPRLAACVPAFEAHQNALKRPLANVAAAVIKDDAAQLALAKSKKAWLLGYESLEGDFHSALPGKKRFVARFFPHAAAPKKKKVDPRIAELQTKNDALTAQLADLGKKIDSLTALLAQLKTANDLLVKQVADLQPNAPATQGTPATAKPAA